MPSLTLQRNVTYKSNDGNKRVGISNHVINKKVCWNYGRGQPQEVHERIVSTLCMNKTN
jgi:hypothetical protein